MRHPLAGLPETDGHLRHVDMAELLHLCGHVRADATDMLGEIEAAGRSFGKCDACHCFSKSAGLSSSGH